MKMKKRLVVLSSIPMVASVVTGALVPLSTQGVLQLHAEGVNATVETSKSEDGQSFWQGKFNPWKMSFTVMKSGKGYVDTYYDGEKMIETQRQANANLQQAKYLKTESGKIFAYAMPKEALEGVVNPDTKLIETYPTADKHPFGALNAKYYETKVNAYYKSVNQMAEINGLLIATSGTAGSSTQYFSVSRDNGETWQDMSATMKPYGYFEKISKEGDKLVAQRVAGGKTIVSESTDGLTWTDKYSITSPYIGFDFYQTSNSIVGFVNTTAYISTDGGKTYVQQALPTGAKKPVYLNNKFVTFNKDGALYSVDGKTWTKASKSARDIRSVYVDPVEKRFIALSRGYISISKDGDTWTTLDVNLPSDPLDIVFDNDVRQNQIVENKKDMKTINDDLPLGKRMWEANTSHFSFSAFNIPQNFPAELKNNYMSIKNLDDFYLASNGKMIVGNKGQYGFQTYNIVTYPNTVSYVGTMRTTVGLTLQDAIHSTKSGKILGAFNSPYKGVSKGVAVFNRSDFTDTLTGEVLPTSVVSIPDGIPQTFFEGDGYIGLIAVKNANDNTATSIVYTSKDDGKTWEASNEVKGRIAKAVVTEKGEISLFGDTFFASGKPVIATSKDGGKTFTNIDGITTIGDSSIRTGKHNVAYRDGVYVWNVGRPYRSTDLVNWTPVVATGNINTTVDKEDVEYDPINDAFVLTGYNYVGLSRDGISWRELTVHPYQLFEGTGFNNYKYDFVSFRTVSEKITNEGMPLNDWQKKDVVAKDETAPTATISLESNKWTNKDATIKVSDVTDEGDGFDYILLPDGTKSTETSFDFVVAENGSYTFKVYDKAGNVKEYVLDVNTIDKKLAELDVKTSTKDWTKDGVEVSLEAKDSDSGIEYILLDNGDKVESDKATFTAKENGEYSFKAVDKAGNVTEEVVSIENIDKEAPSIEIEKPNTTWTNDKVTIEVSAKDDKSGVDYIKLPNGEKVYDSKTSYEVKENGEYVFSVVDKVGNEKEERYVVKNIDKTPANAVITTTNEGTTKEDVLLSISSEDSESGIRSITLPDGEVVEKETATFKATENGKYSFKVEDNAGNIKEYTYEVKNIDRSIGKTILQVENMDWSNESTLISIEASDEGSGIDYIVTPDGEKVYSDNFVYEAKENGTYTFTTVDKAGNEWKQTIEVKNIDKTIGQSTITPSTTKATNAKFGVILTASGFDKDSGIEFIVLPDNTVVVADKATFEVHENGVYNFGFVDKAGNKWEQSYEVKNLKGNAYNVHQRNFINWNEIFKKKISFIHRLLHWLF